MTRPTATEAGVANSAPTASIGSEEAALSGTITVQLWYQVVLRQCGCLLSPHPN